MIEFTRHAEEKLRERRITKDEVIDVITNPDEVLFDTVKGNLVAIRTKPIRVVSALVTSELNQAGKYVVSEILKSLESAKKVKI